jgi:hypothetical protein
VLQGPLLPLVIAESQHSVLFKVEFKAIHDRIASLLKNSHGTDSALGVGIASSANSHKFTIDPDFVALPKAINHTAKKEGSYVRDVFQNGTIYINQGMMTREAIIEERLFHKPDWNRTIYL